MSRKKSSSLESMARNAANETELIKAIYEFVCKNVKYDKKKAAEVKSGYLPVPDDTMKTGKGICFDYAALAASMLRSQGIPTKMIFGYVAPKDLYHAWNMFYTEETGWITVKFEISGDSWNRLDLTFSANGADAEFIGDGSRGRGRSSGVLAAGQLEARKRKSAQENYFLGSGLRDDGTDASGNGFGGEGARDWKFIHAVRAEACAARAEVFAERRGG